MKAPIAQPAALQAKVFLKTRIWKLRLNGMA
jgi:hypothetical protein